MVENPKRYPDSPQIPLNVAHAAAWHRLLVELTETQSEICLNLSSQEDCDTSGVQLLLAAKQAAAAQGKPFVLKSPATSVREAAVRLGFDLNIHFQVTE